MPKKIFDSRYWGTGIVYLLLSAAALFLAAQTLFTPVKRTVLNQFHLKQKSFVTFALVHFIPPMYSFANEVWYAQELRDFQEIESGALPASETAHFWFNHYPLRLVTFSGIPRQYYFEQADPQFIYVRSKFMDQTARTVYQLKKDGKRLIMQRIETEEAP